MRYAFVILSITIIVVVAYNILMSRRDTGHMKGFASMEMTQIRDAVQRYAIYKASYPWGDAHRTNGLLSVRQIYETLCKTDDDGVRFKSIARWDQANTFVDPWGKEYHSRVTIAGSGTDIWYEMSIWSDGPNRQNEVGKGDDVVLEKFKVVK